MRIPFGVIGCGSHAIRSHIELSHQTNLRLSAVFDPLPERMQLAIAAGRTAAGTSIECFRSVDDLLHYADVYAVIIASPDEQHAGQLLAAVQAGKHVLVEKPLGSSSEDMQLASRALEIAASKNLVVTSCYLRRFDPPYLWVKSNLKKLTQEYGELIRVTLDFSYHEASASWKHTRSLLLDHFPHEIDFLRWLLGDHSLLIHKLQDSDDSYGAAGAQDDGVQFVFSGTRKLKSSIYPETIHLRFARGEYKLHTKTGLLLTDDHDNQTQPILPAPPTDYDRRTLKLMQNFALALQDPSASYLSTTDLFINTQAAISLVEQGVYRYEAQ